MKRRRGLPLAEDDIAQAFGRVKENLEPVEVENNTGGFSYPKLVLAIALSAPLATFLSLLVIDLYDPFAQSVGLRATQVIETSVVVEKKDSGDDKFTKLLGSIEKSNRQMVSAIKKQTTAITKQASAITKQGEAVTKLANKKPSVIKVEPARAGKVPAPKLVVVRVPSHDKFELAYEKQKVLELSGLDLDDPVAGTNPFKSLNSRDALKETIRALDTIIAAAKDHAEVGDFLKSNSLKAKKYALKRLSKLK